MSNPTFPGFYIGAQGGGNWLLNNQSYVMDTGWAAGGKVGYDFVGPRFELEGMYHSNTGTAVVIFPTGYANVRGRIEQASVMANALYDFFPGAMVTPYIGAGAGVAFVDANIQGCSLCLTMFAYQGILGVGYNATPAMRISLEGRYYGTTNPGPISTRTSWPCSVSATSSASRKWPRRRRRRRRSRRRRSWCSSTGTARTSRQQALNTIRQAAAAFKSKGNARITATGHTDTSGPEAYNMALSLRRANAVKDALVREGVPAQAISVVGRGEQGLLVQTGDGVREPQNRRVEIVVQ